MLNITFVAVKIKDQGSILLMEKKSGFRSGCSRVAIFATALLVFWIYLGSLINFHQHHIFGRTLITNGILCKKEETPEVSPELPSLDFFQSTPIADSNSDDLIYSVFSEILLSGKCLPLVSSIGVPACNGLRAPPART